MNGLKLIAIFVIFSTNVVACDSIKREKDPLNTSQQQPLYIDGNQQGDMHATYIKDKTINKDESAVGGGQNEIGYFKYRVQNGQTSNGPSIYINRNLLAKYIAYLVTVLPNVKEATALVTDDHIFLGIHTQKGMLNRQTMKEVKRTAESVTPRFFQVHITTDKKLESQIANVGMRMNGNYNVEGVRGDLEQLLRNMGDESPPDLNESTHPSTRNQINPMEK